MQLNCTIVKAMRLTIILLLAAVFQVTANTTAQTVSYSGKDVGLEEVFTAIKQQTGYAFFYNSEYLKSTTRVTVNLNSTPIQEALTIILAGQPLSFSIEGKTVVIERKPLTVGRMATTDILAPPGDVRGRVTNENGEPLIGANITVKDMNIGATTDNNGYYKISTIAVGNYTFEISFIGYATKRVLFKATEKGETVLNITLTPSLVNLDEMTVTSTLSKRAIRAYPATIAVIKQEDLKNRNLNNIANVLESVPGIIVTPGYESTNSGASKVPEGILIRGTSAGARIKYLLDGVEINSSILQTMDPNEIEKLEILKGPMASTLYGSGAAGGIISITTKKGQGGKTRFNFKTMYTQYANEFADYSGYSQNYSANVSGGGAQFDYLLGAAYNLYPTTKLSDINNGIDQKTWSYNARIGGKVKHIAADLTIQYGNEKSGSSSTDSALNKYRASLGLSTYPVYPLDDIRNSQRSFLTSLHLAHTIADNWYQDLTIGYNISNVGFANHTMSSYDSTYLNYESLSSKINARYFMFYEYAWSAALKSNITAGFEYNNYEDHTMTLSSTLPLMNFFTIYNRAADNAAYFNKSLSSSTGYFAEIVTGFKNKLFLTSGIRYDVNSAYGDNVGAYPQPRVGLSYVIEQGGFKVKPRIVWGVSSTPPDAMYKIAHTDIYSFGKYVFPGNQDIKPQRSVGYEFGADVFYGSNYSINFTWYDQKIKDLISGSSTIDYSTNPITVYSYYYNIAKVINRGLEVSAKAVLDPFVIDISYTQTTSKWGKEIGQSPTPTIYPGAPNLGIPKKSSFVRLTYKVPSLFKWSKKGGNICLDWRYNGSSFDVDYISYYLATDEWSNLPDPKPAYPDQNNYYLWQKGYNYFNLRADYSVTNYTALYIDIQNLFNKHGSINGQSINPFPGRRINFGFNLNF